MALAQPIGETVYVGDVIAQTFKAYRVGVVYDDYYNPPLQIKKAPEIAIDPAYQAMLDGLQDFFASAPAGWAKSKSGSYPNTTANVYSTYLEGSPEQNNMLDWVRDSWGANIDEALDRTISLVSVFRLTDNTKVPKLTYVVEFADGSKVTVSVDLTTTNAEFKVVPNSGRDSHNNTVYNTPSSNPTGFNFTGPGNPTDQDAWAFVMDLLGYGVPIVQGGARFACTIDPGNGRHCVRIY